MLHFTLFNSLMWVFQNRRDHGSFHILLQLPGRLKGIEEFTMEFQLPALRGIGKGKEVQECTVDV